MKMLVMLVLVVAIAFAGIVNPSTNGTVVFSYEGGDQESTWHLFDMTGRLMKSGLMPEGIRDACINVENLPSGIYGCIIVASGEIVESGIFTKL